MCPMYQGVTNSHHNDTILRCAAICSLSNVMFGVENFIAKLITACYYDTFIYEDILMIVISNDSIEE